MESDGSLPGSYSFSHEEDEEDARDLRSDREHQPARLLPPPRIVKSKPEDKVGLLGGESDVVPHYRSSTAGSHYNNLSVDEESEGDEADNHRPSPSLLSGASLLDADAVPSRSNSAPWSPRKRSFNPPSIEDRPFKRIKGTLNHEYLALLNVDIQDAADRFLPHDGSDLTPSQIGFSYWTDVEKELFFEALSRLGPDDAVGIAARVKTKAELEVAQYLSLLRQDAAARRQRDELKPIVPVDIPAAVELSQPCCRALDEAADAVSFRQEGHEETLEKARWGPNSWLISQSNWSEMEAENSQKTQDKKLKSLELFKTRAWLRLSEHVFMNASFEEYNWRSVSDEKPAIRTTAFEDLYSLAFSVTRRLVAAALYVSESRVRTKREVNRKISREVWRQDVEAAILSLGLNPNGHKFWARCPRRLRLDVYDDSDDALSKGDGGGDDEDPGPMSYDDVEKSLGYDGSGNNHEDIEDEDNDDDDTRHEEEDLEALSDTPSIEDSSPIVKGEVDDDDGVDRRSNPEIDHGDYENDDKEAIQAEASELTRYSGLGYPFTARARRALEKSIRAARAQEAYADAVDASAAYHEERRMWALVGQAPPRGL
ncbi:hypothetical protein B0T24DRAFT_556791, partial [Lasiosphaeria ovina]